MVFFSNVSCFGSVLFLQLCLFLCLVNACLYVTHFTASFCLTFCRCQFALRLCFRPVKIKNLKESYRLTDRRVAQNWNEVNPDFEFLVFLVQSRMVGCYAEIPGTSFTTDIIPWKVTKKKAEMLLFHGTKCLFNGVVFTIKNFFPIWGNFRFCLAAKNYQTKLKF